MPLPALFLSHGAPTLALEDNAVTRAWRDLGASLAPLLDEGVLVLGSGGIVHNLRELDWQGRDGRVMPWARAFNDWIAANVNSADTAALIDWLARAPEPLRAHPTPEHFMPFFVSLGAGGFPGRRFDFGFDLGSLGMDGYAFDAR